MLKWLRWPFWNVEERRMRALWRFMIFMFVFQLTNPLGKALGVLRSGADPGTQFMLSSIWMVTMAFLMLLVFLPFVERRPLSDIGFWGGKRFWAELGFGAALGAGLMAAIFYGERAAGWLEVTGGLEAAPGRSVATNLIGAVVLWFAAGTFEELLFRVLLLRTIAQGFRGLMPSAGASLALATLISSSLFGIGHASNPNATFVSSMNVALAGIMLSMGYVLTGRLAIPVGLHVFWNMFQGTVFGFPVSGLAPGTSLVKIRQAGPESWTGGTFGPEAGIIGLVAMGVGTVAIAAFVTRGKNEIRAAAELVDPIVAAVPPSPPMADAPGPVLTAS